MCRCVERTPADAGAFSEDNGRDGGEVLGAERKALGEPHVAVLVHEGVGGFALVMYERKAVDRCIGVVLARWCPSEQ